jgi:hypothetical protein
MHRRVRYFQQSRQSLKRGEKEMATEPKRKPHQGDHDRDERERRHREKMLDDALKNTFPASDPVSIVLSTPPAADRDR